MSIILLLHISSALALTISGLVMFVVAIARIERDSIVRISRIGFGATLVSGLALVAVSPQSMTHVCVMMTAYAMALFGIESLYKKRTQIALLPQENTV